MVAVTHECNDRHSHHPAHLAQGLRQHGRCSYQRIPRFGIYAEHIAFLNNLFGLSYEIHVIGKLPFPYASHALHKPLQAGEADKRVDCDYVVGVLREDGFCNCLEIKEGVVVAKEHVGSLDTFHSGLGYLESVHRSDRSAENPHQRFQIPLGSNRLGSGIPVHELFFHNAKNRYNF